MNKIITDRTGKQIGRIVENNGNLSYFAKNGSLAARYVKSTDSTLDSAGRFYGRGDQGMGALNEYNDKH